MSREELKEKLIEAKFEYGHDDEFHRDVFTNEKAKIKKGEKSLFVNLQVFVDYYTVRIIWYYDGRNKVSKSYYMRKDIDKINSVDELFSSFIAETSQKYKIEI